MLSNGEVMVNLKEIACIGDVRVDLRRTREGKGESGKIYSL